MLLGNSSTVLIKSIFLLIFEVLVKFVHFKSISSIIFSNRLQ